MTAVGSGPLAYRWRRNGSALSDGGAVSGAGTSELTISPAAASHAGSYDVVVTDAFSQNRTSSAATLTVHPIPGTPAITVPLSAPPGATGVAASVSFHAGSTWVWTLSGGSITGGQGSNQLTFSAGGAGVTMTLGVTETGTGGCASPPSATPVQVDFTDVPPAHPFHSFVVALARGAITSGCGGGNYCPASPVTRAQMAVFLLRSRNGPAFVPAAATGTVFDDVPAGAFAAAWIERLAADGVTSGCGGGNYCPGNPVTRAQMAVFLLRTREGPSYAPPPATGTVFGDVPANAFAAAWIEELADQGITGGCGSGNYCPANPVTRGQMAVFLDTTFALP